MKAIICNNYGSPKKLQLKEIERPVPKDNEMLAKIYAASVNPADLIIRGGIVRLFGGVTKPKDPRVGLDFAGRIDALGKDVTQFQVGDEVFGQSRGSFAEFALTTENLIALKPSSISFEAAAAVPVAAITALQGLRDRGGIQSGERVLVNGASGGVGTFAVQIAKSFGTEVTGVTSTRNLDMVRSFGADYVIDYTREDFTKSGRTYDLVFDAVGNHSVGEYKLVLSPGGVCVIAGFTSFSRLIDHILVGSIKSAFGDKKVGFMGIAKMNHRDLVFLSGLLESGKIVPVIDRHYSLQETPEALQYLSEKHSRGKVIIDVAQPEK